MFENSCLEFTKPIREIEGGGLKKNRIIFQLSCLIVLFCGVLVFNDKNPPVLKIHKRS